jgi:hypothetical protein
MCAVSGAVAGMYCIDRTASIGPIVNLAVGVELKISPSLNWLWQLPVPVHRPGRIVVQQSPQIDERPHLNFPLALCGDVYLELQCYMRFPSQQSLAYESLDDISMTTCSHRWTTPSSKTIPSLQTFISA